MTFIIAGCKVGIQGVDTINKKELASLLKSRRSRSGLSTKEVVQSLKTKGIDISEKTLYGYESGVSAPNVPTFICLCEIYGINDLFSSYGKDSPNQIKKAALAAEDWTYDQYNDFFNADLYTKIYILLNCGIPSFSGYEEKLAKEFPTDAKEADFNKLYSLFITLDEHDRGEVLGFASGLTHQAKYKGKAAHSKEQAG